MQPMPNIQQPCLHLSSIDLLLKVKFLPQNLFEGLIFIGAFETSLSNRRKQSDHLGNQESRRRLSTHTCRYLYPVWVSSCTGNKPEEKPRTLHRFCSCFLSPVSRRKYTLPWLLFLSWNRHCCLLLWLRLLLNLVWSFSWRLDEP